MPATFIRCCGETFTAEEALEHVRQRNNSCEWTYEVLAAMLETSVSHPSNSDPSRISTTTLTAKCMRRVALERYNDYEVEPADLWPAFRGTLLHGQLEAHIAPECYGEVRFIVDDLGVQIPAVKKALPRKDRSFTGSPDLVDPVRGILYDYKRTKEVPRFNTVWGDHIEQLNINRWLADHADKVEVKDEVLDLRDPEVRSRFVPVEWQELCIVYVDDHGPKPIVVTESIDVPTRVEGKTKKARVPAVWSDSQVEALIAERYIAARLALSNGYAPIPVGWENQGHKLCGWCHMRDTCAALEREGK